VVPACRLEEFSPRCQVVLGNAAVFEVVLRGLCVGLSGRAGKRQCNCGDRGIPKCNLGTKGMFLIQCEQHAETNKVGTVTGRELY